MFGLSKDQMYAAVTLRCPLCGAFLLWRKPAFYKPDGSQYPKFTTLFQLDRSTVAECQKCSKRWAVFADTPSPSPSPSTISFHFIETDRTEEPLGDEKRQIDNSHSFVESTRRFAIGREWTQSYTFDRE